MVPGTDAVMIDVKAENNNLQVIPNDHVISPFDIIFEGEFGNNLHWNVMNVFDVVLPGQVLRAGDHHGQASLCSGFSYLGESSMEP